MFNLNCIFVSLILFCECYLKGRISGEQSCPSYIAHSSFALLFPFHLTYLVLTTTKSAEQYISEMKATVNQQLTSEILPNGRGLASFPTKRFAFLLFAMVLGLNGPGLLWYASVAFTS